MVCKKMRNGSKDYSANWIDLFDFKFSRKLHGNKTRY